MALIAGITLSVSEAGFISLWPRVIIGLIVFLLPGCFLFLLIPTRDDWDLAYVVGYGFAYSLVLVTILGFITRTLALSIGAVEFIWYLLALLGFGAVIVKTRFWRGRGMELPATAPQFYLLLATAIGMLALYAHGSILMASNSDDQSHRQAEVNSFLRDDPLGWSEPFFETGNRVSPRVVLSYWTLAQALVVQVSGVPILLVRYLLNPFAVIVATASMYAFARNLGQCRRTSLIVVILGLLGLSLVAEIGKLPGNEFFVHGKMDKNIAAFALAPVAISSAWLYWRARTRRALCGFALSFLACAFVHSIIGAFAGAIIGVWCMLLLVADPGGRRHAIYIGLLTLLLLSPAVVLRLTSSHPDTDNYADVGLALTLPTEQAGHATYVVVALALLAVATRRSDPESALVLAFIIVIGFGLLPIGVWVYGRVLAHWPRVFWLMPYGYVLFFIIEAARKRFAGRPALAAWPFVFALPICAYFLQFHSRADFRTDLAVVTDEVVEMLRVAEYIDAHHDERIWIAASPESENRNRAIAIDWKVVSLSHYAAATMAYFSDIPLQQAMMQRADNFRLYDAAIPVEEKLSIIDRYGIEYLLFPKGYAWMVDALYQTDKERFELVYSGESLRLVRVHY